MSRKVNSSVRLSSFLQQVFSAKPSTLMNMWDIVFWQQHSPILLGAFIIGVNRAKKSTDSGLKINNKRLRWSTQGDHDCIKGIFRSGRIKRSNREALRTATFLMRIMTLNFSGWVGLYLLAFFLSKPFTHLFHLPALRFSVLDIQYIIFCLLAEPATVSSNSHV